MTAADRTGCPSRSRHDDNHAYNHYGCRCPTALRIHARTNKRTLVRQARHGNLLVPAHTAATMLRALAADGHSTYFLADVLGTSQFMVRRWLHHPELTIHLDTQTKIRGAYGRLAGNAPTGKRAVRTRAWAAGLGWIPTAAYDNDTIGQPWFSDRAARELITRTARKEVRDSRLDRLDRITELLRADPHRDVPSITTLADWLDVTDRQIIRDLRDLRDRGEVA